jgi:hypothetical protein
VAAGAAPAGLRDLEFGQRVAALRHALRADQKQQQIAVQKGLANLRVEGLPRCQLRAIDKHLVPAARFERKLQALADFTVLRRIRNEDPQSQPPSQQKCGSCSRNE